VQFNSSCLCIFSVCAVSSVEKEVSLRARVGLSPTDSENQKVR
jgi:hypothetical protein